MWQTYPRICWIYRPKFPWFLVSIIMNDVTVPRGEQQQQASFSNCILGRVYLGCVWVGGMARVATIPVISVAGIIHFCQIQWYHTKIHNETANSCNQVLTLMPTTVAGSFCSMVSGGWRVGSARNRTGTTLPYQLRSRWPDIWGPYLSLQDQQAVLLHVSATFHIDHLIHSYWTWEMIGVLQFSIPPVRSVPEWIHAAFRRRTSGVFNFLRLLLLLGALMSARHAPPATSAIYFDFWVRSGGGSCRSVRT